MAGLCWIIDRRMKLAEHEEPDHKEPEHKEPEKKT